MCAQALPDGCQDSAGALMGMFTTSRCHDVGGQDRLPRWRGGLAGGCSWGRQCGAAGRGHALRWACHGRRRARGHPVAAGRPRTGVHASSHLSCSMIKDRGPQ